ncbi:hypothetical protein [Deinococcus hopiensis]|uniref:DUF1616 domain-containing protein n=1 Tax=Deinococcus hopiensis KR-140 TaxID=695939 RepID=A0A1W1UFT1_9DEIO|nr:hypothetical protein [Deinococcus hopiensis]SMB79882.1 hypothetical protein SAMN00790413_05353 [Deinococcus hopiensis KR-140]
MTDLSQTLRLLLGGVLLLLAVVPGVLPSVQLLSGLALCLTVPGVILMPGAMRREPVSYWTLVLTSSLLVTFTAALALLYLQALTRLGLLLLVAWLTGVGWAVARLSTRTRPPAAPPPATLPADAASGDRVEGQPETVSPLPERG